MDEKTPTIHEYTGRVPPKTIEAAKSEYNRYKSERNEIMERVKDNERYYRSMYRRSTTEISEHFRSETPLLFSCIENAAATANESYPTPNILERTPEGEGVAEILSKILPVQLEMCNFRDKYDTHIINKLKYGTSIFGVFYNEMTRSVDIRVLDLFDVYVDPNLENIQDSKFVFVSAVVDNETLKTLYPEYADLFTGDASVETSHSSYSLPDSTQVLDCYYKKTDGTVHMMKICKETVISATEDMEGYENGLYSHGKYPLVFDTMFPIQNCPYGFGFIDIGKSTQIQIHKLDGAITKNVLISSQPRYFSKKGAGVNEDEFRDISKPIVKVSGDISGAVASIQTTPPNQYALSFLKHKEEGLKEILSNRDFQQGGTTGGVTAASAIEALKETGEKRSRKMINQTYKTYRRLIYMTIELMRQFYDEPRTYRINDDTGRKTFVEFSNEMMTAAQTDKLGIPHDMPIEFDVEVIPQQDNPYTAELQNQTIMSLWNGGFFLPDNAAQAQAALKCMSFKTKNQLASELQGINEQMQAQQQMQTQQQMQAPQQLQQIPVQAAGGII